MLDANCKAHELDNLYVVDTSFFPSIGAVNPALTAMANALRVGDHLLERLGCGAARPPMAAEHNGHAPGSGRRRVVIVGGGFGGLSAARALGGADVDVTLVDRHSHHLFQPLLYQLACGGLSPAECATPIRAAVRRHDNVRVLMGTAVGLDAERRELLLDRDQRLPYDSLIVACGAETSYFGNDEWREHSFGLKTLTDTVALRNRIYSAFEEAERAEDPAERQRWLTFVVVGGGPTGVELAGELSIIARHTMKNYYRRCDPTEAKVILLDAGPRLVRRLQRAPVGEGGRLPRRARRDRPSGGSRERHRRAGGELRARRRPAAHRHAHRRVGCRRAGGGLRRPRVGGHRRRG